VTTADVLSAIVVRPISSDDISLICDSFARQLQDEHTALGIRRDDVNVEHRYRLLNLLARKHGVVATIRGLPNVVGWAIGTDGVLFFAYVKHAFRRWGIADKLCVSLEMPLKGLPVVYWTRAAKKIYKKNPGRIIFDWREFNSIKEIKICA